MEETQSSPRKNLLELIQTVTIALVLCVLIYVFIATPNQIEGQSMEPTFANAQLVLTSKVHEWLGGTPFGESLGLNYQRGDIVVFQKPGYRDFIKRVIAVPGDTIQIKNGKVYVNGNMINETYLPQDTITQAADFIAENSSPKELPKNHYFLMGDNRNNSHDSRFADIGFINRDWIKGKVLVRYWPLQGFWIVNHANI